MSSEAKHSPLPWRVETNRFRQHHILGNDGTHVAGPVNGEANAAFIVETVNAYEDLLAEKSHLADTNRALAEETEKTWAKCDKLKGLLRRAVPCIESCIGHLRNDRATSLGDPKTMMVYTRTIEDVAVLLDEVREALKKEASDGNA